METVSLPSNVKFCKSGFRYKSYNTGLTVFGNRLNGFLSPAISQIVFVNDFDKNNRKHLKNNNNNEIRHQQQQRQYRRINVTDSRVYTHNTNTLAHTYAVFNYINTLTRL